ncbi:tyrosinase [Histoplasma capsulatum]|uniref:tyrosinase n=1 Tax=Ajellomyces capsulatus TaxID=5037 RepID=A0A8A1MDM0_AJECA|nr:tyrosinase [Histoplasma capsulatum]
MAYKYYPIQGVQKGLGPGSQVPIRRDFNEWSESQERRDQIQVVLFILALREFQATPPDSRDSYFQIAGIHGMPYKSWDEHGLTVQETHRKGYCVHANSLFPIWHRPYLSLYEYGECCATSRCPTPSERVSTSNAWRDGVVNNKTANKFIFDRKSITDFDYGKTTEMVYRLLTYPLDFVSFATTARDATMDSSSASKVINDMNIEFIHNNIHYWVGGDGGHMSQIPVATFDPIFWFHHCGLRQTKQDHLIKR